MNEESRKALRQMIWEVGLEAMRECLSEMGVPAGEFSAELEAVRRPEVLAKPAQKQPRKPCSEEGCPKPGWHAFKGDGKLYCSDHLELLNEKAGA